MPRPELDALLGQARANPDPVERLVGLRTLETDLVEALGASRAHRAAAIRNLREVRPDLSWAAIGHLLAVTGERARQLADEI